MTTIKARHRRGRIVGREWHQDYEAKRCSAWEAARRVQSGDSIFTAGLAAIPFDFTEALAARKAELHDVDYFCCLSPYCCKIMDGHFKKHTNFHTLLSGGFERLKAPEGNINQLSVHLAESDRIVEERMKPDVLAISVSPQDKHGWMTFGPDPITGV